MAHKIRVRCPLCGMLVWQSRLNKDYPFEFVIQEITAEGYQKIKNRYKPARKADTEVAGMFQTVLALKMIEKAEDLLKEVGAGIEIDVQIPEEAKEELGKSYEKASEEKVKVEHEVEHEPEEYVYEFEIGEQEYEIEIPVLQTEDVKRKSFFKRLRRKSEGIEEMEAIRELEIDYDVKDVEYELEIQSLVKSLRR